MLSFAKIASLALVVAAAPGASADNSKTAMRGLGLRDFGLPDISLPNCGEDPTNPICTILKCIDIQSGSFLCHCSVVVEAFKQIPDAKSKAMAMGLDGDFIDDTMACCPVGTTSVDFTKCMVGCDAAATAEVKSTGDPACDLLDCVDPLTGEFGCMCDLVVGALNQIPTSSDGAKLIGITPEVVDKAAACCPDGTALDYFNSCFGSLLPGTDDGENPGGNPGTAPTEPATQVETTVAATVAATTSATAPTLETVTGATAAPTESKPEEGTQESAANGLGYHFSAVAAAAIASFVFV